MLIAGSRQQFTQSQILKAAAGSSTVASATQVAKELAVSSNSLPPDPRPPRPPPAAQHFAHAVIDPFPFDHQLRLPQRGLTVKTMLPMGVQASTFPAPCSGHVVTILGEKLERRLISTFPPDLLLNPIPSGDRIMSARFLPSEIKQRQLPQVEPIAEPSEVTGTY